MPNCRVIKIFVTKISKITSLSCMLGNSIMSQYSIQHKSKGMLFFPRFCPLLKRINLIIFQCSSFQPPAVSWHDAEIVKTNRSRDIGMYPDKVYKI